MPLGLYSVEGDYGALIIYFLKFSVISENALNKRKVISQFSKKNPAFYTDLAVAFEWSILVAIKTRSFRIL